MDPLVYKSYENGLKSYVFIENVCTVLAAQIDF
jgi:hypothetical protein